MAELVAELSAQDLRQLADLADLRDKRRANNLEALYAGPALGVFAPGVAPLEPLLPEVLASAMSALALRGFSVEGIVRSVEGYSCERLPSEVVDRVVIEVVKRRARGEL